ncbi:hypothetical protein OIU79_008781, partial [Salix purpurea]
MRLQGRLQWLPFAIENFGRNFVANSNNA